MKVLIARTSEIFDDNAVIKEFGTLEDCINELLMEDFDGCTPSIIISKPGEWCSEAKKSCDYIAEIYDTWRE